MQTKLRAVTAILGASVLTTIVAQAHAGCGDLPRPMTAPSAQQPRAPANGGFGFMRTAYFQVADQRSDAGSIVGLWKFTFVAQGNTSGPPDGTPIDAGFVTWHRDGTELMNSGRAPQTGSFCMGVWKHTAGAGYQLNHWALSWSDDGSTFVGPTNIRESVSVGRGGNRYSGTFTLDQYDPTGTTVLAEVLGTVTATRITAD
jgi:hypothetical protein